MEEYVLSCEDIERIKENLINMVKVAFICLGNLKGYKSVQDCLRDEKLRNMVAFAIQEVAEAVENQNVDKKTTEKVIISEDIIEGVKDIDAHINELKLSLIRKGCLISLALVCRKAGILAYFLTKIIAVVFSHISNEDDEMKSFIDDEGIEKAIKNYCGLEVEVQLVGLIANHFQQDMDLDKSIRKINLMKEVYKKAFFYEKRYGGCPQCSLAALCEISGKEKGLLFQSACALSGGGASNADGSCGSYAGGLMFISTYFGRRFDRMIEDGDEDANQKAIELGQKLHDKFINIYGDITCKGVQEATFGKAYYLRDQNEADKFVAAGAHDDKCPSTVATSCSWVVEILFNEGVIS